MTQFQPHLTLGAVEGAWDWGSLSLGFLFHQDARLCSFVLEDLEPAPQRPLAEDHQLILGGPGTAFWVILPSFPFPPSRYMKYALDVSAKKALSSLGEVTAGGH